MSSAELELLIIDDDAVDQDLVVRSLSRGPLQVPEANIDRAATMSEAIERLVGRDYTCILLDLGLPDGIGLANLVRLRGLRPDTPLVVLTGLTDEDTASAALRRGALAYINKGDLAIAFKLESAVRSAAQIRSLMQERLGTTAAERIWTDTRRIPDIEEYPNGELRSTSPAVRSILGREPGKAARFPLDQLVAPSHLTDLKLIRARALRGDAVSGAEIQMIDDQGMPRSIRLSARLSSSKDVVEYFLTDLTRARSLQLAEQELHAAQTSTPDAIIKYDLDGRVTGWNEGAELMLGHKAEDIIGQSGGELLLESREAEFTQLVRAIRGGKAGSIPKTVWRDRSGRQIAVSIHRTPRRDLSGGLIGATAVIRDRAAIEAAEKRLRGLQKEVDFADFQLGLVQRHLADRTVKLTEKLEQPTRKTYTLANEILELIRTFDDTPAAGTEAPVDCTNTLARIAAASRKIRSAAQRGTRVIETFQSSVEKFINDSNHPIILDEFLNELLTGLRSKLGYTQHKVTLHFDEEIVITGNPRVWAQIMTNLLVNSWQHAWPEYLEGEIEISGQLVDEQLQLTYRDNGCGIPAPDLERLWHDSYTTRELIGFRAPGLIVVKTMVDQLGGQIEANSEPGDGLEFVISTPLNAAVHRQIP